MKKSLLLISASALLSASPAAFADKLDDIISSGKLRCAVMLDFPPAGSRDANQKPIGFDVDYCTDLAAALGVEAEIVETPQPDRIPALVSNRADVIIASTSDTLQRAKVVGFTIPYMVMRMVVLTRNDTGIETYEDLKGRRVGNTASTFEESLLRADVAQWGAGSSYSSYQTQNDTILAVAQGHIDATAVTDALAHTIVASGKYPNLKVGGLAPYTPDYFGIAVAREEYGLINYLNLFIHLQVRNGRYAQLYRKWFGAEPAELTTPLAYR